jgi:hypothetical protein
MGGRMYLRLRSRPLLSRTTSASQSATRSGALISLLQISLVSPRYAEGWKGHSRILNLVEGAGGARNSTIADSVYIERRHPVADLDDEPQVMGDEEDGQSTLAAAAAAV